MGTSCTAKQSIHNIQPKRKILAANQPLSETNRKYFQVNNSQITMSHHLHREQKPEQHSEQLQAGKRSKKNDCIGPRKGNNEVSAKANQ